MGQDLSAIPLLARREIEARLAAPLLEAFTPMCGREEAYARLAEVVNAQARQAGAQMAERLGRNDLLALDAVLEMWGRGGAEEFTILARDQTGYDFNVTRCAYAEMYRELGLAELGLVLSCGRDAAFFQGFNPAIRMTRTQTVLGGAGHCDFRFRLDQSQANQRELNPRACP